jgi:hypothetical protein
MNRKARRAQRTLPPDAKAIEKLTSTSAYQQAAAEWLADFKASGVALPLDEAARSFAAATAIDVPLAAGILRRFADPEGYARFIERQIK